MDKSVPSAAVCGGGACPDCSDDGGGADESDAMGILAERRLAFSEAMSLALWMEGMGRGRVRVIEYIGPCRHF